MRLEKAKKETRALELHVYHVQKSENAGRPTAPHLSKKCIKPAEQPNVSKNASKICIEHQTSRKIHTK